MWGAKDICVCVGYRYRIYWCGVYDICVGDIVYDICVGDIGYDMCVGGRIYVWGMYKV